MITDTYKAIPRCMEYVINLAHSIPAQEKIAVISEMRPVWRDRHLHYKNLASSLDGFSEVYFVGPRRIANLLTGLIPNLHLLNDESQYEQLALELKKRTTSKTLYVIKGAGSYHLSRLVALVLS